MKPNVKKSKRWTLCLMGTAALCMTIITSCKKEIKEPVNEEPAIIETYSKLIFVADEEDGTISVVDASKFSKIKAINIADGSKMYMPHNVQVAPNGKTVWVTGVPMVEGTDEQVIVIDAEQLTIKARINVGSEQHLAHVVLDDMSKYAYVTANESNEIIKINAINFTEEKRFMMDSAHKPHGLRYASGKLFVACMDAKSMAIIDVSSGLIKDLPLGGIAVQTAVTPDGKYVFASLYDIKSIAVFNVFSEQLTIVPLPSGSQGPIQIYPTPDNKTLYICDQGVVNGRPSSNKVFVYDIQDGMVMSTVMVGNAAHGVVINNVGVSAFVTNSKDNTISVINISNNTVSQTVPVGKAPNGISYWYKENGITAGMK